MGPDRMAEALELSQRLRNVARGKRALPDEVRHDPLGVFEGLRRDLERHPGFYDAGFDHDAGNGNLTERVLTSEGEVSVTVQVTYQGPSDGTSHKEPAIGHPVSRISASITDPTATYPDGHLARETVELQNLQAQPDEETLRALANLQSTVRVLCS